MRVFLGVIFLSLLGYGLAFVLFVSSLPATPAELPRADGIVALTGGDERLDTAVSLLEHGVGKRLLVSGVSQETSKQTVGKMSEGGDWQLEVTDAAGDPVGSLRFSVTRP